MNYQYSSTNYRKYLSGKYKILLTMGYECISCTMTLGIEINKTLLCDALTPRIIEQSYDSLRPRVCA